MPTCTGWYCPPFQTAMWPCPVATYNSYTARTGISDCAACPANTYNAITNVTVCFGCNTAAGAFSLAGMTACITMTWQQLWEQAALDAKSGSYLIADIDWQTLFKVYVEYNSGQPWVLILQYFKAANTLPPLHIFYNTFPSNQTTRSLGYDDSANMLTWGHMLPSFLERFKFDALRFFAKTDAHPRIVHFATGDPKGINYITNEALTGAFDLQFLKDNNVLYPDHSAFIPQNLDTGFSGQNSVALTEYPFGMWGQNHWAMRMYGANWQVDNAVIGGTHATQHQVYISWSAYNCKAGSYCPQGLPIDCPAGSYCKAGVAVPNICDPGYYCLTNSTTARQHSCEPGFWCPAGSTYGNVSGCNAGYYCAGNATSAQNTVCPNGYFCFAGATSGTLNPCPKGAYCSMAVSMPTTCPAGTFQPNPMSWSLTSCKTCIPGSYCPNAGTFDALPCNAGYYCTGGSTTATQILCPPGYYCPSNTSTPIACTVGVYCTAGVDAAVACPMGSINVAVAQSQCVQCPVGRYNTATGLTVCILCPIGTYNNLVGQTAASACQACPTGYFNVNTGQSVCTLCPAAYYCTANNVNPTACPIGKYSVITGQIALSGCSDCPSGSYSINLAAGLCYGCAIGFFCPAGSTSPYQIACPMGFYCLAGSPIQTPCPAGTYNGQIGVTACTACKVGYYCPQGSTTMLACSSGSYNPSPSKSASSDCLPAPPGFLFFSYFFSFPVSSTCFLFVLSTPYQLMDSVFSPIHILLAMMPSISDRWFGCVHVCIPHRIRSRCPHTAPCLFIHTQHPTDTTIG
jgi:hypothetical protein